MHQELAQQLREKGIRDEQVIQVMMKVRRQDFVSPLQAIRLTTTTRFPSAMDKPFPNPTSSL